MKIRFLGGARTVTGSQHLLLVNGRRILLECGLFQGRRSETYERNRHFQFDPGEIDAVVLSHAHIDHSGNLPNLVSRGFQGPIYATSATVDLCRIMLRDSAYLHQRDVEWLSRRKKNRGRRIEPLYTMADAEAALEQFEAADYETRVEVAAGVEVTFREAGHILGSAGVEVEVNEQGRRLRLGFSGDIGRHDVPILKDPRPLRNLDALIMESTYGNRRHEPEEDLETRLCELLGETARGGGRVLIPAFAVGRTQLLVYTLHRLFDARRLPDMPIFVDSPLAVAATEIFRAHPECFDRDTYRHFLKESDDPFGFERLRYIRRVEDSKKLNDLDYPHIIISASGMAEGGRILHHLRQSVGNPRDLVLMVGFAAAHTLARRLMEGRSEVRILGDSFKVRCRVETISGLSAHADRAGLLAYAQTNSPERLQHIFLVHGEAEQALPLKDTLREKGYRNVRFPDFGEEFTV